ncbi:MAG: PIG-L family deacetylase [Chitinophagales bacterium]|nr:PIG-L family deacetylase [Chitinophagaceae bacterium]MCB9064550.1 PIG-L family deacetylase [Chitinophagales bacterium]
MRKATIIFILFPFLSFAQQLRPSNSAQIYHELNQLKYLTNVLYFAAHPDDENTRMLAWLVNEKHIPTAYLSLTRGDGGQNILGPHLGASLGLIRTHELLEARKIDGAQQFFTRAVDFGYSKTAEETFNHWDNTQLTDDAVWIIRKFRPDVIICRFPPDERAGHGQHAASAIIAKSAFNAAGDNNMFPEHFKYYTKWQPKRILFNAYRFRSANTTSDDQFKQDVGQYNPLLGMGYGELAGISRSIHRSQGAGTRSVPGVQAENFELVDGADLKESLFDGIDISWNRINRQDIGKKIDNIIAKYDLKQPELILPELIALYKDISTVEDEYWKNRKLTEVKNLILHCSGFMAEVYTDNPEAVRGEQVPLTINFIARSGATPVKVLNYSVAGKDTTTDKTLPNDGLITYETSILIPENTYNTEPYWLRSAQPDDAHYPVPDEEYKGMPNTPCMFNATVNMQVGDLPLTLDVPVSYKTLDATHGDVVEQLRIVPDVILNFTSAFYLAKADRSFTTGVHIHANKAMNNVTLSVYNDMLNREVNNINLKEGTDTTIIVHFEGPYVASKSIADAIMFAAITKPDGETYGQQQILIKYEHLPTLQFFTAASSKMLIKTWECKAKRIAYIEGAGDNVSEVLRFAGLEVDILKPADITLKNLQQYDAVMVGIRAINTVDEAPIFMPILLEYTKNGGTLVMQYNTSHRLKTEDIGPYPLSLSRDRVTEEMARVALLNREHRLMTYPNKINELDFANWVQERGLYFADKWDEHYTPLFSMNDKGEEPLKGSTLYTPYGKGHYIYTSLSFFRQLPAGNHGAVRLLCNFLSVGK